MSIESIYATIYEHTYHPWSVVSCPSNQSMPQYMNLPTTPGLRSHIHRINPCCNIWTYLPPLVCSPMSIESIHAAKLVACKPHWLYQPFQDFGRGCKTREWKFPGEPVLTRGAPSVSPDQNDESERYYPHSSREKFRHIPDEQLLTRPQTHNRIPTKSRSWMIAQIIWNLKNTRCTHLPS